MFVERLINDSSVIKTMKNQENNKNKNTNPLYQLDGRFEIESEVDEVPLDTLLPVLLLFQGEHVVVEELLNLLVC